MSESWEVGWGGWVLGDLADTLRRAADLLGRSQGVSQVVLSPPEDAGDLPQLRVILPSESGVASMRHQILRSEHVVDFLGEPCASRWSAETAGFVVTVEARAI